MYLSFTVSELLIPVVVLQNAGVNLGYLAHRRIVWHVAILAIDKGLHDLVINAVIAGGLIQGERDYLIAANTVVSNELGKARRCIDG